MEKDIKAIALLLTTQAMINLGEIENPVTKNKIIDMAGAEVFVELLHVLKDKTEGNLTQTEEDFISELLENVDRVFDKKQKESAGL